MELSFKRHEKEPGFFLRYLDRHLSTEQFSAKEILDLYIPMVLDQFSIFAISILASAMVSASSQEAISAVSLVGSIAFMFTALFTAISTGGTVLVAQAKGRGDGAEIREVCGQTICLTTLIGILSTTLLVVFAEPIVRMFFGDAGPVIVEYGVTYLKLYAWSFVPFAAYMGVIACFRGLGKAKQCLTLTLVINVTHLLCSFLFINMLEMGVAGSGWSFIVARVVGAVAAIALMLASTKEMQFTYRDLLRVRAAFLKKIVVLALPFAIEQMLFQAGQLLTSTYISKLPGDSIAANSIALSIFNLLFMTAFALQNLIMTVCGQCIGAKHFDLARHYVKKFIRFGRVAILINALLVAPLLPLLMMLYQPSATVEPMVYVMLGIGAVANVALWCDGYLIPACLRAAGDATFTTVICLISMWLSKVAVGYLLTMVLGVGVYGVWLSYFVDYGFRAVVFHLRFKGHKWEQIKL